MLVEVNLLPKKEPKNYTFISILLAALLILLVAGLFLFWQGATYNNQSKVLDNQIATTQKLVEIEQAKVVADQSSTSSVTDLESAVAWASEAPIKAVPVIEEVTGLLPERGFIQTISYTEIGTVNLTVQFDTSRDAAYYLKTLLDSEWFSEVVLSSVSSSRVETTETEETTETTESSTVNDKSTSGQSADTTTSSDQVGVDGEQAESTETAETEDSKDNNDVNSQFMPRYIGQYQLTLNREFIKDHVKAENSVASNEGGDKP